MSERARVHVKAGRADATATLRMTPLGLLAVGGLVAAILLSTTAVVRAARH